MSKIKKTTKDTREFINFVRLNPALWKKSSPGYNKTKEKKIAWTAIGKGCKSGSKMTGEEAKARWKCLRDKFAKEYNKVRDSHPSRSGAGVPASGEIYTPDWEYYQDLLFLKDQIIPKSTTSNMEIGEGSGESIKSEKKAGAKSGAKSREKEEEKEEENFELPSWFQIPEIQTLINTGEQQEEPLGGSIDVDGDTDNEFDGYHNDDSDADDGQDVVMTESAPKKFDIERKVQPSDKPKKRKISDDTLTKELATMALATTKAMQQLKNDVPSQQSTPTRSSSRDSFDEEIEPIMNMMKYSLRFVNENIRVECATEML